MKIYDKKGLQIALNSMEKEKNMQAADKIRKFPHWSLLGLIFWLSTISWSLLTSYLFHFSKEHCDILPFIPNIYCLPALITNLMNLLINAFEYPVNLLLSLLNNPFLYYSKHLITEYDIPKILIISLFSLFIGATIGKLIAMKFKNVEIRNNNIKLYYIFLLIILCLTLFIQIINFKYNSYSAEEAIIPYTIDNYNDFESSPFCSKYNCVLLGGVPNANDKYRAYSLDNDYYLEMHTKNNFFKSIMLLNLDNSHNMKGKEFNIFYDLLRSIDSNQELNNPDDSVVKYITSRAENIIPSSGNSEATTWGSKYYVLSGRKEGGGHQSITIGLQE